MELLGEIKDRYPGTVFIMLTGHGGVRDAVCAIQHGAADFLEKPYSPEELRLRVAQLYRIGVLNRENERLREQAGFRFGYHRMVGHSNRMLELKETITRVGPSNVSILVQGETGTGMALCQNKRL